MSDTPSPRTPPLRPEPSVRRFFGGLLLALGILWMALSGACTLLFVGATVVSALTGSGSFGDITQMLPLELVIGVAGIAPGLAFFFIGRALLKPSGRPR
jgi:hypothetical protein